MTTSIDCYWRLLQSNRDVAGQVLTLANRLGVPDADRWAAGVMAHAQRGGAINSELVLQAARVAALGHQSASPARGAVLSVDEIRQLATERAQSAATSAASPQRNTREAEVPASADAARASTAWAEAQPALRGTTLLRNGRLSATATTQLEAARRALAEEVGQPLDSIPRATAALKVASDYWTARVSEEPGAFEKARNAQTALTQAMAPLRAQATQQRSLMNTNADYQATLASIKALAPQFKESQIADTKVGEVTLSQLRSSMPAQQFASLQLDIARQYLAHYQTQAQTQADVTAPASNATQAFIAKLKPAVRKDWEMRLSGGRSLSDVISAEAQKGGALTTKRIESAVKASQPVPPPTLPEGQDDNLPLNQFFVLRYDNAEDFRAKLAIAWENRRVYPMQIRTADGSRHLDIYRSPGNLENPLIIDRRDRSVLLQPSGTASAIVSALGIHEGTHGSVVVSYGEAPWVMAERPHIYRQAAAAQQPRSANSAPTPQNRLAQLERDYVSFLRSLGDESVPLKASGSGESAQDQVSVMEQSAERLRTESPGAIGQRGTEIAEAARRLEQVERDSRQRGHGESSAIAERLSNPPPAGQSVMARRLATIRTLMNQTPDLPESFRGPLGEAKLLEGALDLFNWLASDIQANRVPTNGVSDLSDNTFTPAQRSDFFSSPARFFDYLQQSPAAWQRVMRQGLDREVQFQRMQLAAANGGVLMPAQLKAIDEDYHGSIRADLIFLALKGFTSMRQEMAELVQGPPSSLRAGRPRYDPFVNFVLANRGFGHWLGVYVDQLIPDQARNQAITLDFVGNIERNLAANGNREAGKTAIASVDQRLAQLRQLHDGAGVVQHKTDLASSIQALSNFRALLLRLYP